MEDDRAFASFQDYWEEVVQQPFATWQKLEKTYHLVAENAPELFEKTLTEAEGEVAKIAVEAESDPLNPVGTPQGRGHE